MHVILLMQGEAQPFNSSKEIFYRGKYWRNLAPFGLPETEWTKKYFEEILCEIRSHSIGLARNAHFAFTKI
jgi:hypothetical protein